MAGTDDSSTRRAGRRRDWPVRTYRLGAEPSDDLRGSTTVQQRVEMVWQLTLEAWALTARPLPDYERAMTPVSKVLRRAS